MVSALRMSVGVKDDSLVDRPLWCAAEIVLKLPIVSSACGEAKRQTHKQTTFTHDGLHGPA
jgi:hypothetical protein